MSKQIRTYKQRHSEQDTRRTTPFHGHLHFADQEIAELRAEIESLSEDARRYRWLKRQHESGGDEAFCVFRPVDLHLVPVGSLPGKLDRSIDAEIAKDKQ